MFVLLIYFKYNEGAVRVDKGNTETITQVEFPGFSTDDQTIDDDNGYVLYVTVDGVPNSDIGFCSFDTSVSAPAC